VHGVATQFQEPHPMLPGPIRIRHPYRAYLQNTLVSCAFVSPARFDAAHAAAVRGTLARVRRRTMHGVHAFDGERFAETGVDSRKNRD